MKARNGVLVGATALTAGSALLALRNERARGRAVDLRLGALVQEHALDEIDPELRAPHSQPEIAVVIAAFNEAEAIAGVLDGLPAKLFGYRVTPIVVVDGGVDDTADVVERHGGIAIRHETNRGQGDALRTGFALARERKSEIVVTMDADGQHRADDLPQLLGPVIADEADYVQGSRYLGAYDDAGGARDLGIRFFTRLVNAASGAGITDCTNGFRAIRGDALGRLRLEEPRFSASELIIESACQGLRMREVSVHIASRSHGESKKPRSLRYPLGYLGVIVRTWRR